MCSILSEFLYLTQCLSHLFMLLHEPTVHSFLHPRSIPWYEHTSRVLSIPSGLYSYFLKLILLKCSLHMLTWTDFKNRIWLILTNFCTCGTTISINIKITSIMIESFFWSFVFNAPGLRITIDLIFITVASIFLFCNYI